MWGALAELLFPARCIGCQRRGLALCEPCRAELPWLPRDVCFRCASRRAGSGACRGCRRLSPALSWVRAPFAYAGAARTAVLNLKFRSATYLVPLMAELLEASLRDVEVDGVVPVPLSMRRQRERGFNQAALLASKVATSFGAELVAEALIRTERPPQHTLGAVARLANLKGAFDCTRHDAVQGKRLLVVDDVVTTGATVSACADT